MKHKLLEFVNAIISGDQEAAKQAFNEYSTSKVAALLSEGKKSEQDEDKKSSKEEEDKKSKKSDKKDADEDKSEDCADGKCGECAACMKEDKKEDKKSGKKKLPKGFVPFKKKSEEAKDE